MMTQKSALAQKSILVVEDEKDLRQLLNFALTKEGFSVIEAQDGLTGLNMAKAKVPDIIILDIMLPNLDGFSVCKELGRDVRTEEIPVLFLTARGEEVDRILGFELGATDYLVKPFSMRELILRIKAILRRKLPDNTRGAVLQCGFIRLNNLSHTVFLGKKPISLTLTEFRLLKDLLEHMGQVRSREQLLDSVWGYSFEGYARTVDTHVRRLRAKLEEEARRIETVRGIGYRIGGEE